MDIFNLCTGLKFFMASPLASHACTVGNSNGLLLKRRRMMATPNVGGKYCCVHAKFCKTKFDCQVKGLAALYLMCFN